MASKKSFPFGTEDMAAGAAPLSDAVKESAQQIWLAGLGAFSKAQAEGGKVFEALVKEGVNMQRKTQTVAEEKITEAAQRMTSAATEMGSRAAASGTSWKPFLKTAWPRPWAGWASPPHATCRR